MNIFVAKLSSGTTSENLHELFSRFGEVASAKVIMDRETGFSKRYGFVEMSDDASARAAIDGLNETEFDGATIVVKEALPKDQRPQGDRPRGGGGGFNRFNSGGGGGGGFNRDRRGPSNNNDRRGSNDRNKFQKDRFEDRPKKNFDFDDDF